MIETHQSLDGFFDTLLKEAMAEEQLALDASASSYLLHLVSDFGQQKALLSERDEPGTPGLVWLYERAAQAKPQERFEAYRRLGDVALFVSGFFSAHIERARSLVGVEYYVDMGRSAYLAASELGRGTLETILRDLGCHYAQVVEVMTRVAEKTTLPVTTDLGAMYARWLRNPESADLGQRLLKSHDVVPVMKKGLVA